MQNSYRRTGRCNQGGQTAAPRGMVSPTPRVSEPCGVDGVSARASRGMGRVQALASSFGAWQPSSIGARTQQEPTSRQAPLGPAGHGSSQDACRDSGEQPHSFFSDQNSTQTPSRGRDRTQTAPHQTSKTVQRRPFCTTSAWFPSQCFRSRVSVFRLRS